MPPSERRVVKTAPPVRCVLCSFPRPPYLVKPYEKKSMKFLSWHPQTIRKRRTSHLFQHPLQQFLVTLLDSSLTPLPLCLIPLSISLLHVICSETSPSAHSPQSPC